MNILFTAWALDNRSGIPLFTADLAFAVRAAGHRVAVLTSRPGIVSREMSARGIDIVTRPRNVPFIPDIIHGQCQPMLLSALRHFPDVPAIEVIHDATSRVDEPLNHARVVLHVAVDERCRGRIRGEGLPESDIRMILNAVDLARFKPRSPLPSKPQRVALFSNYDGEHRLAVKQACHMLDLPLDVIGGRKPVDAPQELLRRYDIVFAKGRCAQEALAVGCAVILCDFVGLGPMVTTRNYAILRPWNFGAALLTKPLDGRAIAEEIRRYNPDDAAEVAEMLRGDAALSRATGQWLSIYREANDIQRGKEDPSGLAQLDARWRMFHLVSPLIVPVSGIYRWPLVGPALFRLAKKIWRMRF